MLKISDVREVNGSTEVPLALEANASAFVVFRLANISSAEKFATTNLVGQLPVKLELNGPWEVAFTPGWGAPEHVTLPTLISLAEHTNSEVRHFSGAMTYTKQFEMPRLRPGERVTLDLGRVANLAGVKVNGKDFGVAWHEPYAFDVTDALQAVRNILEVRVVNTWVNRLIADVALPPERRRTWATWNPFRADDVPLPSGLIGLVRLRGQP
jgi:hypothetical protein